MRLWDVYNGLLTPTQQEITNLYFNLDLTLSEIATEKGITRQGVSECLKTCKKQLEEFENKLRFLSRLEELAKAASSLAAKAGDWAEELKSNHPELSAEVTKLFEILAKDYSEEVKPAIK